MDTAAFMAELDAVFGGDLERGVPADSRFDAIAAAVSGFTTPAELAVLDLAARLLPVDEAYVEVGTFKGRSLCAALSTHPDREFVAVENFMEFGMIAEQARDELLHNVRLYAGAGARLKLLDGDCFRVLARPGVVGPVGVYFYDGAHTGLTHYLALAVVEPLLADEALVLVDDASWPMVSSATQRYLRDRPSWTVLRTFEARTDDDPVWANGLMLLRFRRGPDAVRSLDTVDEARRLFQVHVRGPATGLVWRTLHRFPGLVPAAKRLAPKRSRAVRADG